MHCKSGDEADPGTDRVTRALYSAFIPEEEMDETVNTETEEDYDLDEIAKVWYDEE